MIAINPTSWKDANAPNAINTDSAIHASLLSEYG